MGNQALIPCCCADDKDGKQVALPPVNSAALFNQRKYFIDDAGTEGTDPAVELRNEMAADRGDTHHARRNDEALSASKGYGGEPRIEMDANAELKTGKELDQTAVIGLVQSTPFDERDAGPPVEFAGASRGTYSNAVQVAAVQAAGGLEVERRVAHDVGVGGFVSTAELRNDQASIKETAHASISEFDVALKKENALAPLGLHITVDQHVIIDQPAGEALARWHAANPSKLVVAGDEILEVNGISGNAAAIIEELTTKKNLQLRLRRQSEIITEVAKFRETDIITPTLESFTKSFAPARQQRDWGEWESSPPDRRVEATESTKTPSSSS